MTAPKPICLRKPPLLRPAEPVEESRLWSEAFKQPQIGYRRAEMAVGDALAVGSETEANTGGEITSRTKLAVESADRLFRARGDIHREQDFVIPVPSHAVEQTAVARKCAAVGIQLAKRTFVCAVGGDQVLPFVGELDPLAIRRP